MSQLYQDLPSKSGVYLFKDKAGTVLYVGKAKDLKKRVSSYFLKSDLEAKTHKLVENISSLDFIITTSEIEAFLLEADLIKQYKPFYNIKLADDKFFPYVLISNREIPYVTITRKKNESNAEYFGPYPSAAALKTVLKIIRRIFPFESVKNHQKSKCFYNHLGLCPCVTAQPEGLTEYKKNIRRLKAFLNGKKDEVIKQLEKERDEYSKAEEFEKAAEIQDKINKIVLITSETYDPFVYSDDPSFYFRRITKETESLVFILQTHFPQLTKLDRIECYDISNIQGKNATGSMVVFTKGDANKKEYRRFKIRTKDTPDDFHMMKEVIRRRLKRTEWPYPDLFIIDGGKGQVSAVWEVFQENSIDIPMVGLAKREEILVVPKENSDGSLRFEEIRLPHSTPGINLVRRIRDEAHRFALAYHRLLRKKSFLSN